MNLEPLVLNPGDCSSQIPARPTPPSHFHSNHSLHPLPVTHKRLASASSGRIGSQTPPACPHTLERRKGHNPSPEAGIIVRVLFTASRTLNDPVTANASTRPGHQTDSSDEMTNIPEKALRRQAARVAISRKHRRQIRPSEETRVSSSYWRVQPNWHHPSLASKSKQKVSPNEWTAANPGISSLQASKLSVVRPT